MKDAAADVHFVRRLERSELASLAPLREMSHRRKETRRETALSSGGQHDKTLRHRDPVYFPIRYSIRLLSHESREKSYSGVVFQPRILAAPRTGISGRSTFSALARPQYPSPTVSSW